MINLREIFQPEAEQAFMAETCFAGLMAKYSDEEIGKRFSTLRSMASSPGNPSAVMPAVPIDDEQSVAIPVGGVGMPDDDVSCLWHLKM